METKIQEILKLLKEGRSYQFIQTSLNVSPTKISKIKKEYLDSQAMEENDVSESGSGSGSSTTRSAQNDTKTQNTDSNHIPPSGSSSDSGSDSSSDPKSKYDVRKLELEYELRIQKLKYENREKERAFQREKNENKVREHQEFKDDYLFKQKLKKMSESAKEKLLGLDLDDDELAKNNKCIIYSSLDLMNKQTD
mgnify:CR=1 FL=1